MRLFIIGRQVSYFYKRQKGLNYVNMKYQNFQVVFQEVPGEISLCFSISGCPLRCTGCHSPFLWKAERGKELTLTDFQEILIQYKEVASCVVFMGGEWHKRTLISLLSAAKKEGYTTCLYTGEEQVDQEILQQLTWIKTGSWNENLGGLDSPHTNQRFFNASTKENLNHLFLKNPLL